MLKFSLDKMEHMNGCEYCKYGNYQNICILFKTSCIKGQKYVHTTSITSHSIAYTYPSTTEFQKDVNIVHVLKEGVKLNDMFVGYTAVNADLLGHL